MLNGILAWHLMAVEAKESTDALEWGQRLCREGLL